MKKRREFRNSAAGNPKIINTHVFILGESEARSNLERENSTLKWPAAGRPGRNRSTSAINLARALFNRVSDGFLSGDLAVDNRSFAAGQI
jgi:hypothetical protein